MSNETGHLQVYKGICYQKTYQKKYQKIIVLDLDETIGSFGDLNILWNALNKIRTLDKDKLQDSFNVLIDMYPEFLRYGILNILEFLYFKKASGQCDKLFIYTNNVCNPPWVTLIVSYIYKKLKISNNLFDKIICAFKINNKIVELSRTSKEKSCGDLIRCTLLPKTTEICFIDDNYHRDMINDKVYYIQPFPYHHGLSTETIIKRFILSQYGSDFMQNTNMVHTFEEYINDWFFFHRKENDEIVFTRDIDVFVAQKMMYHIKEFFYLTNRKNRTYKKRFSNKRKTHKTRLLSTIDISMN
uniref:Uncharacterized protein n=1 Tax=viral metagenome TaxID=1070528 RepID=A0A6C0B6C9_9ZZZZ